MILVPPSLSAAASFSAVASLPATAYVARALYHGDHQLLNAQWTGTDLRMGNWRLTWAIKWPRSTADVLPKKRACPWSTKKSPTLSLAVRCLAFGSSFRIGGVVSFFLS